MCYHWPLTPRMHDDGEKYTSIQEYIEKNSYYFNFIINYAKEGDSLLFIGCAIDVCC
jgi:hypothetical protein